VSVFASPRRYYLARAHEAIGAGERGLESAWLAKQAATSGTTLPASVPYQSELAALRPPYTTIEDLTGASIDELVLVGLARPKASAVVTAIDALG
jgi:hypothetical protein